MKHYGISVLCTHTKKLSRLLQSPVSLLFLKVRFQISGYFSCTLTLNVQYVREKNILDGCGREKLFW